ncbi:SOS response-associated peptidase [Corallincola platygyrae]|uniref:Abasic site processing protein n=1 Tax=Corallincola platygyrae TaxID=1193278 RepID=A0ABW4XRU3_9GAMM
MCGRMNVMDDPLTQWLSQQLGLDFHTHTNPDLRPSQTIDVVAAGDLQISARWGIKPSWSKRLLINAQSETVAEKRTFKQAFAERRCVIPFNGWYEWRDEGGPRKQKYLFQRQDSRPLLMAGIWYPAETGPELVTLTSPANDVCAPIHHRMPTLIRADSIQGWLTGDSQNAQLILHANDDELIHFQQVG